MRRGLAEPQAASQAPTPVQGSTTSSPAPIRSPASPPPPHHLPRVEDILVLQVAGAFLPSSLPRQAQRECDEKGREAEG